MSKKVAIVGYSQLKNEKDGKEARERMYYNLTRDLHDKLKITRDNIDTFIHVCNDFADGRTISEVYIIQYTGSYMKDETKVEDNPLNAIVYGALRILSGNYKTAQVVCASKPATDYKPLIVQTQTIDPVYERPRGLLNYISGSALSARAYLHTYKVPEEIFDLYCQKNLEDASKNSVSINYGESPSLDEIKNSAYLYEPIKEKHFADFADGGCAFLLADEEVAKELTDKPVWIKGIGYSLDTYYIGDRDILKLNSLRKAAQRAYNQAGIKDPSKEIDLAELYENYSTEEPIIQEALGLFPEGSGERVIKDGLSKGNGGPYINPSGGNFAGNTFNAAPFSLLAGAIKQLRGEADNPVKDAKVALVHSQEGVCAQTNTVLILSNED